MRLKFVLIFLISVNLIALENDLSEYSAYMERIEDVATRYYAGNFALGVTKTIKAFLGTLLKIKASVAERYRSDSIQYHYLSLLISLTLCDISWLVDDLDERQHLMTKIRNNYDAGFKASFSEDVFSDYFRVLGELSLNLIVHDFSNLYSYVVNAKRFLEKALSMDKNNPRVNIPLALFYTT
ncbi:hypothetical protein [Candidatus Borreliella tachyglossi]|uniref:hypothetical protein n=1 Tax=Candidatus Borreliella tachyglossi TaxID=1964448 RepID=UPI004041AB5E